jgi:hypothetical protein
MFENIEDDADPVLYSEAQLLIDQALIGADHTRRVAEERQTLR